ncbi:TIR domain-containing protein [Shewanella frigidimarina]|uniref:TIR domain-containing protein n=1 Tax=Shewanella frigidimarina TaxID=56812 RepID=UPI003D795830
MIINKHKVFISYHHANDQGYKESLLNWNKDNNNDIFIDASVDTGDIDENLPDHIIRQKIRDEYLRDSTVTILLVGTETKNRKHIDWEIFSSMFDGQINKKSGVLVIQLPSTGCNTYTAAHGEEEKSALYPEVDSWISITKKSDYENRYPYLPQRIIDNLLKSDVKVSVANWHTITASPDKLKLVIDLTFKGKESCNYDLSQQMKRANS